MKSPKPAYVTINVLMVGVCVCRLPFVLFATTPSVYSDFVSSSDSALLMYLKYS